MNRRPEETLQTRDVLTLSAAAIRDLLPQRELFLFVNGTAELVQSIRAGRSADAQAALDIREV